MGTREEGVAGMIVKGYSGIIRPHQVEAGKCKACGDAVYVDANAALKTSKTVTDRVTYLHLGCEPISSRPELLSDVIPVPEHET